MGDCSGKFCTFLPGAGGGGVGEGLSALGNMTLSQSQGYLPHIGSYLMIACCSKANCKLHGDNSNAFLLPIILLIKLFHLHSSAMKGRFVQTFVPTSYQGLRAERLFVDGFINSFVHVFLPNLKWVEN